MQPLMNGQELFVAGLNHQTSAVQVREQFALGASQLPALLGTLRTTAGLREAVVVSTCNRFEIYGTAPAPLPPLRDLFAAARRCREQETERGPDFPENAYLHRGTACIRHLFRVASSLDSLVVGETEIVGQVKAAYLTAQGHGATGSLLNRLFQKALSVSKQVRNSSAIGRCPTSVGSVAVDVAARIFGEDLRDRTVLIIGAGKISESTLRHLAKRGAQSILVSNRSYERARELAAQFQGEAFHLDALEGLLARADIVVSSTSAPRFILREEEVAAALRARRNRPLFLIDLAVPRDIDPAVEKVEGVFLYNVDQLAEAAAQNRLLRQAEASTCEEAVAAQASEFARRLAGSRPSRIPLLPVQTGIVPGLNFAPA